MATRKTISTGQRIRILVVDDSVVIRSLVTRSLEADRTLEVVGVAAHGGIAVARIPQLNPDVIILDLDMPVMDGLETLGVIRREYPDVRVVMFSALTEASAAITLKALSLGADDYVTKLSNESGLDGSLLRLRQELIPKVKQFFLLSSVRAPEPEPVPVRRVDPDPLLYSPPPSPLAPRAIGIGVSTGGPVALTQILPELPADFPLPVLIVQHMPALFTHLLAERLQSCCRLAVHEARDGELVEPGKILIAPGDFHTRTVAGPDGIRIRLDQSPLRNSCRPAVDVLFTSLAEAYGGAVIAVVLTGMGQDGLRGAEVLKSQGGYVIAQDKRTSVVWGMPGAVVNAGLSDTVLPIDGIAGAIRRQVTYATRASMEPVWRL